jgi:hypothetical protein
VLSYWARTWGLVRCRAGLGGRLSLNSFIQTRQMYMYEIPMGNRVRIVASQTHTRLPNGWRFCPISIPMGTIFVPYPYPNRGIPHGLAGIGSPLTSLSLGSPPRSTRRDPLASIGRPQSTPNPPGEKTPVVQDRLLDNHQNCGVHDRLGGRLHRNDQRHVAHDYLSPEPPGS